MTKFKGCYLTNAGLSMILDHGITGIIFTRAETGAGIYASDEDVSNRTDLKDKRQQFGLEGYSEGEKHTLEITFKLQNTGLLEEYGLSEVGIYAKSTEGEEILYCIAFAVSADVDMIPADDGTIKYVTTMNLVTAASADAKVSVVYAEEHKWTIDYVAKVLGDFDPEKGTIMEQMKELRKKIEDTLKEIKLDLNMELLKIKYDFIPGTTKFPDKDNVDEYTPDGVKNTHFLADGNIINTLTGEEGKELLKMKTTFNEDGSITRAFVED